MFKKEQWDEIWEDTAELYAFVEDTAPEKLNGLKKVRIEFEKAKGWMMPFLDSNGRLEVDVDANLAEEPDDIRRAIETCYSFGRQLAIKERFGTFLAENGIDPVVDFTIRALTRFKEKELVSNLTTEALINPTDASKTIPAGIKVSKYIAMWAGQATYEWELGHFSKFKNKCEDSKALVTEIVNLLVANVFSALKKNGQYKVCLSVNPIDFIMMSEHTAGGWRSCHNIRNGEYRTAGMSLMMDSHSVVLYAYKEHRDYHIGKGRALNLPIKVWRLMAYIDKINVVSCLGRHYPQERRVFTEYGQKLINQILQGAYGNTDAEVEQSVYLSNNGRDNLRSGRWHYQDGVTERWNIRGQRNAYVLNTGTAEVPCLYCGRIRVSGSAAELNCGACCSRSVCYECGKKLNFEHGDHEALSYNGRQYCEPCFNSRFSYCDLCDGLFDREDTREVFNSYREVIIACGSCQQRCDVTRCDDCGNAFYLDDMVHIRRRTVCSECSVGYEECSYCNELTDDTMPSVNDTRICGACTEANCYYCRTALHESELFTSCGQHSCHECAETRRNREVG